MVLKDNSLAKQIMIELNKTTFIRKQMKVYENNENEKYVGLFERSHDRTLVPDQEKDALESPNLEESYRLVNITSLWSRENEKKIH